MKINEILVVPSIPAITSHLLQSPLLYLEKMCENAATKHQQAFKLGGGFAPQGPLKCFDYRGRTVWTASAHIITAVIGSGVLSLAWATAQLGWIAGPTVLFLFSFVTYYTSCLLAASATDLETLSLGNGTILIWKKKSV
ncbi:putative amino acid transporter, transmembrane domain-containing protein [Helianthus annuus]|uniref:Amino acid transporter, transmembrane domain-containing protein n=1 Tax=Helianthus annuus TaxID=4232 RepID=A0A251UQ81_HELAN|nr:putative amino acid transporter, transmembrane domain-containing protein [Helianthus annuus]KAJ0570558.1 putative amino acid transporter, transmembrane domain-containing protein [Helianthus annuus]KAJ0577422.1 putative amino acid transporter, transmembrane domain-containing protein [Helianthus annuus]KAJ0584905.1 putative amino acid transporter, transmembrane domain-containing protein [Helianthus annuus]KAJ0750565.1 putative amino acid transporter, transmembrane domain-containing protein [He